MKMSMSKQIVGALALLCSSAGMAATVTVIPSTATPAPGSSFTVTVHGDGFPLTAGATLALSFSNNVQVTNIAPSAGSPFTGGTVPQGAITPGSFPSGSLLTVLGPLVGTLPSGSFDAFTVTFDALSAGAANIVVIDDQSDICWGDATTNLCVGSGSNPVQSMTYNQANVTVQAPVVPVPAAAWLLMSALGSIAGLKRLRRS